MRHKVTVGEHTYLIEWKDDTLLVDGETRDISVDRLDENHFLLFIENRPVPVTITGRNGSRIQILTRHGTVDAEIKDEKDLLLEQFGLDVAGAGHQREIRAPMPGLIVSVPVTEGQEIRKGNPLVIIEAMKMENELRAHGDGIVRRIHVSPGDPVTKNQLLLELES